MSAKGLAQLEVEVETMRLVLQSLVREMRAWRRELGEGMRTLRRAQVALAEQQEVVKGE